MDDERNTLKRAERFRPAERSFDSRAPVLHQDGAVPDSEDFDDIFFATHGVGDNPYTEKEESVRHLIDPNEASLEESRFVRNIIRGMSHSEAYLKAFNLEEKGLHRSTVARHAEKILKRPRVARKMYELRQRIAEMEDEDLHSIIQDLNSDRKLARDLGQPSAAISATKVKAALLGLTQEKKQTTNITIDLSDRQKQELLSRIGMRTGQIIDHGDAEDADFDDLPRK